VVWTLGAGLAVIAVISGTLGIGYSYFLKDTVLLGNGIVGFLSGITVAFGGLAAGSLTQSVGIAALLVFLFVFIREILKTIADQKSDALSGVCTVATRLGTEAALRIFQTFVIVFIVTAVMPWFLHLVPDRYLCAVVLGFILPTVGLVILLTLKFTDNTVRLVLRATKLLWFSGLLTLALLK
jgi:geranylgeranylglycerol-phosphate geranylgeranyltransferase